MADKKSSPLESSFVLSAQEKRYILVICTLLLLGIIARFLYLDNRRPGNYEPGHIEETVNEE